MSNRVVAIYQGKKNKISSSHLFTCFWAYLIIYPFIFIKNLLNKKIYSKNHLLKNMNQFKIQTGSEYEFMTFKYNDHYKILVYSENSVRLMHKYSENTYEVNYSDIKSFLDDWKIIQIYKVDDGLDYNFDILSEIRDYKLGQIL
jgi:hypothetical protein